MTSLTRLISFYGAPLNCGQPFSGTSIGPAFLRAVGLKEALQDLGHQVTDHGDLDVNNRPMVSENGLRQGPACQDWHSAMVKSWSTCPVAELPIFMGGDHFMSAGSIPAMATRATVADRPLFILWLDAHPDFHTLETTQSGNLHGTPMAYATGQSGFSTLFPAPEAIVPANQVMMMGLRSIDLAESARLRQMGVRVHDMRSIDEGGVSLALKSFLEEVTAADGHLHVSFDLDFLDPSIAPAVGTPVPGGVTLREAHLIMEMVHDSALLTSLDLVELNPMFDIRGASAQLMVDLTASLFGRRIQPV